VDLLASSRTETDPRLVRAFQRASAHMAAVSVAIGGLVLIGWLFDLESLRSVSPSFASMKVNTAVGFALAGTALVFQYPPTTQIRTRLARVCGCLVLALGAVTVFEYALHVDFGVAKIRFRR
jgi:hypothetical protein